MRRFVAFSFAFALAISALSHARPRRLHKSTSASRPTSSPRRCPFTSSRQFPIPVTSGRPAIGRGAMMSATTGCRAPGYCRRKPICSGRPDIGDGTTASTSFTLDIGDRLLDSMAASPMAAAIAASVMKVATGAIIGSSTTGPSTTSPTCRSPTFTTRRSSTIRSM